MVILEMLIFYSEAKKKKEKKKRPVISFSGRTLASMFPSRSVSLVVGLWANYHDVSMGLGTARRFCKLVFMTFTLVSFPGKITD